MEKKICKKCKKSFVRITKWSYKQWSIRRFCSNKCKNIATFKRGRDAGYKHTPETLKKLSENNHMLNKFSSNTYHAIHLWLRKFKKTACEYCGSVRFVEYALKKGKVHNHKRENYMCLCSSCHKIYDYTDERRKKLSESLKGRKITWSTRPKKV